MNKKALISFGVHAHAEMLEIARPSFEAFAELHGYDFIVPEVIDQRRPPAWYKVAALASALAKYDEALFIDADCVIVDGAEDIQVPEYCWQAMVRHNIQGVSDVPNTGFWLVRQPMREVLAKVWSMTQHINHGWWEQGAVLELMGFDVRNTSYCYHLEQTELYKRTYFLEAGWNRHVWDTSVTDRIRVQHATMYTDRCAAMRVWAEQAWHKQTEKAS